MQESMTSLCIHQYTVANHHKCSETHTIKTIHTVTEYTSCALNANASGHKDCKKIVDTHITPLPTVQTCIWTCGLFLTSTIVKSQTVMKKV